MWWMQTRCDRRANLNRVLGSTPDGIEFLRSGPCCFELTDHVRALIAVDFGDGHVVSRIVLQALKWTK